MTIYMVTNTVNGKRYIGQTTTTIERRWACHCYAARNGGTDVIHCAIRKYGAEAFALLSIATASTMEELNALEYDLIREHGTLAPGGYNVRTGGDNSRLSQDTKDKLRALATGRKASEETKRKMSEMRRNPSQAFRAKISQAMLGRVVSEATRQRLRERVTTPETRAKLSRLFKGKPTGLSPSPEVRKKMSDAHKRIGTRPPSALGRKLSPERCAAIRQRMVAHWSDPENRRKQSERLKAWAEANK